MALGEFESKAKEAITELRREKLAVAIVVHHDDADGLCAGAITKKALEREGIKVKMLCLEKFYEEVVEDLHSKAGQTIFYADIGYLALVGSSEIPEGFLGINQTVLEEALAKGIVQQKGKGFEVVKFKLRVSALFSKLQILGAVGYYQRGPEIGVDSCLEGFNEKTEKMVNALETKRKEANRRLLGKLYRERLRETAHIQWFDAGDVYASMGTKVIGQFSSFLSYQTRLIKPNKYILGFVDVPQEIPEWGMLKDKFVKASVRAPKSLQSLIDSGKLLGAVNFLDKASEGFGVADGHQYVASVIVPTDKKQALLENSEKSLADNG